MRLEDTQAFARNMLGNRSRPRGRAGPTTRAARGPTGEAGPTRSVSERVLLVQYPREPEGVIDPGRERDGQREPDERIDDNRRASEIVEIHHHDARHDEECRGRLHVRESHSI